VARVGEHHPVLTTLIGDEDDVSFHLARALGLFPLPSNEEERDGRCVSAVWNFWKKKEK
jgi:hypothetical protein